MTRPRRSRRADDRRFPSGPRLHSRAGDGGPHGPQGWERKEGCLGAHAHAACREGVRGRSGAEAGTQAHAAGGARGIRARMPGAAPPAAQRTRGARQLRRQGTCADGVDVRRTVRGDREGGRRHSDLPAARGPGERPCQHVAPGASGKSAKCPPRTRRVATGRRPRRRDRHGACLRRRVAAVRARLHRAALQVDAQRSARSAPGSVRCPRASGPAARAARRAARRRRVTVRVRPPPRGLWRATSWRASALAGVTKLPCAGSWETVTRTAEALKRMARHREAHADHLGRHAAGRPPRPRRRPRAAPRPWRAPPELEEMALFCGLCIAGLTRNGAS